MRNNNLACFVLAVGNERDQREDSASPELFSTPPEDQGISDNKVFNQQTDIFFSELILTPQKIYCATFCCAISRLSMIILVKVVLTRTVVDSD